MPGMVAPMYHGLCTRKQRLIQGVLHQFLPSPFCPFVRFHSRRFPVAHVLDRGGGEIDVIFNYGTPTFWRWSENLF